MKNFNLPLKFFQEFGLKGVMNEFERDLQERKRVKNSMISQNIQKKLKFNFFGNVNFSGQFGDDFNICVASKRISRKIVNRLKENSKMLNI